MEFLEFLVEAFLEQFVDRKSILKENKETIVLWLDHNDIAGKDCVPTSRPPKPRAMNSLPKA